MAVNLHTSNIPLVGGASTTDRYYRAQGRAAPRDQAIMIMQQRIIELQGLSSLPLCTGTHESFFVIPWGSWGRDFGRCSVL